MGKAPFKALCLKKSFLFKTTQNKSAKSTKDGAKIQWSGIESVIKAVWYPSHKKNMGAEIGKEIIASEAVSCSHARGVDGLGIIDKRTGKS